jgi:hypothetical protein
MSTDAREAWIADSDGVETRFDSKEQITAHLSSLEQQARGRVSIKIDHGPIRGWRRFLGMKRDVTPCFAVEWDSDYASLIFLDDAWSEYRAIDGAHPVVPSEEVRRNIAHGELRPHPIAECMEKARAFAAIRDFLSRGSRPDWLTYEYVP